MPARDYEPIPWDTVSIKPSFSVVCCYVVVRTNQILTLSVPSDLGKRNCDLRHGDCG